MCEAVQHHVVADVDDGRDVRRAGRRGRGPRASGRPRRRRTGPPARREHRSARRAGRSGPPLVPSPPAMPVRIPSDRHQTVVSVLREAAQVNGDVEAYVEPAVAGAARRSLTFAEWDRAADGVAGHLARLGVAQGRRRLPAAALVHRLRRALRRPAPPRCHHLGHQPPDGGRRGGLHRRAGRARCSLVVDPEAGALPTRAGPTSSARAEAAACVGRARRRDRWPELAPHDPGRRGVDQRDDRPAQGGASSTTPTWPRWPGAPTCSATRATAGSRPLPFAHVGYMTRAWDEIAQRRDDDHHAHARGGPTTPSGSWPTSGSPWPRACPPSGRSCWPATSWTAADLRCPARRRDRCGPHDGGHGGRGAPALRACPSSCATPRRSPRSGPARRSTSIGRGGGDDGGPPGGRRRAGHRRRRRAAPCPTATVGRVLLRSARPCAATGAAGPGRGRSRRRAGRRRRPRRRCSAPDGWLTTGTSAGSPRGQPAAVGPGARALHPRWLQRVPGRGRGGAVVAPVRGPGGRGRACPTTSWARSGVAVVVAAAGRPARSGRAAGPLRPGALRLQGPRRPGGRGRAPADPDDEGGPGPPGRPGRAGGGGAPAPPGAESWSRRRGARQ